MKKYYPGETVNIHIQSLINIIQDSNWLIATKTNKGKSPWCCGNGEQAVPIYSWTGQYM